MIAKNDNDEIYDELYLILKKRITLLEEEQMKQKEDYIKALELISANTQDVSKMFKLIKSLSDSFHKLLGIKKPE